MFPRLLIRTVLLDLSMLRDMQGLPAFDRHHAISLCFENCWMLCSFSRRFLYNSN